MTHKSGFRWRKLRTAQVAHLVLGSLRNDMALCGYAMPKGHYLYYNYGQKGGVDDFPRPCMFCRTVALRHYYEQFVNFMSAWNSNWFSVVTHSPQRGIGGSSGHEQNGIVKETQMPSNSLISNSTTRAHRTVKRSTLSVYDLFKRKPDGRTYMHTGTRTQPPSGGKVDVAVGGKILGSFQTAASIPGVRFNGREVIGYQSLVVAPDTKGKGVTYGEDGTTVSFENEDVIHVGRAEVKLNLS